MDLWLYLWEIANLGRAPTPTPSQTSYVSPSKIHVWVSSLTFLAGLEEAVFFHPS